MSPKAPELEPCKETEQLVQSTSGKIDRYVQTRDTVPPFVVSPSSQEVSLTL